MKTDAEIKEMIINISGLINDPDHTPPLTTRQLSMLLGSIYALAWSVDDVDDCLNKILEGP